MDKKKTLLAFIRISGGSSWYQSEDNEPLELMALKAVKQANKIGNIYSNSKKMANG